MIYYLDFSVAEDFTPEEHAHLERIAARKDVFKDVKLIEDDGEEIGLTAYTDNLQKALALTRDVDMLYRLIAYSSFTDTDCLVFDKISVWNEKGVYLHDSWTDGQF